MSGARYIRICVDSYLGMNAFVTRTCFRVRRENEDGTLSCYYWPFPVRSWVEGK